MAIEARVLRSDIIRERLLARLERARPRLLFLLAPAGYGKSTFARQYLDTRPSAGVCDCTGVRTELDLARLLLGAVAAEKPGSRAGLAPALRVLDDATVALDVRLETALHAWRDAGAGCTLIERAGRVVESDRMLTFLARVLGATPEDRSVVVCARENLHLHLTRFAAPHEIVVLRAEDLAFDRDEVRAIFAPNHASEELIDRILATSRGWPIAVLLLRRFAAEGRIDALIDRLGDVAFEELHDYFVDRVVASHGDRLGDALFACAAIPGATAADLRIAFPDERALEEAELFARESPFLVRERDGTFAVHPILGTLLVEHHADRRSELLATVAAGHAASGDYLRAAELYRELGDRESSASALAGVAFSFDRMTSPAYERVLRELDPIQIARYPLLWCVASLRRLFCVDSSGLVDESVLVWRTMPADASILERLYVTVLRVLLLAGTGRTDEATVAIDELRSYARTRETDAPLATWTAYLRAFVEARIGRLDDAEPVLDGLLPLVASYDLPAYKTFLTLGADIARVRGDKLTERRFIERAIELGRRSALDNIAGLALAEAGFGAWLAGDDASSAAYNAELGGCIERAGASGFNFFHRVLAGAPALATDSDGLRHIALGNIVAAARAVDETEGASRARAALQAAIAYRSPFIECLASIALASWEPAEFDEAVRRARAAAMRCDSLALRDAVESFARRRDHHGFLQPFVERFATTHRGRPASLEIDLSSGSVRAHGRPVKLSGREAELLFALAARREATARAHLAALLWPEADEESARNALSVCLHRLRRNIGASAVVRDGEGYRLCDGARVDAWEVEQLLSAVRTRGRLEEADRLAFARVALRLDGRRPARMERWEWFAPQARHIDALRVEVNHRLAVDALHGGDPNEALVRAQEILGHDPFDEPAREVAIRAYLALGDRAAAVRHFRHYRELLAAELQCEPSPFLTKLLD